MSLQCNYNVSVFQRRMPMQIAHTHSKEDSFNFRVDSQLKTAFQSATAAEDVPAAQVLRNFMRAYVEKKQRQNFAAEAKRQSALIAAAARDSDSDEAQVMRELEGDLQDVSNEWK